jgi:hypothetical protein
MRIRNPGCLKGEPGSAIESNASASLIREQQAASSSPNNREQQLQGKEQQRAASSLGREQQRGAAGKEQRGSGAAALKTKSNLQVGRDSSFYCFFVFSSPQYSILFVLKKKKSTCSV